MSSKFCLFILASGVILAAMAGSALTMTQDISSVARGDALIISGSAPGAREVAIWIFGTNEFRYDTIVVNSDGTFSYTLARDATQTLSPGEYAVVIQIPGPDSAFEVYPSPDRTEVIGTIPTSGRVLFTLGPNGLASRQAANALMSALDSSAIDDTYTTLSFLVQDPGLTINPPGQVPVGATLVITGTTDLAADDQLIVEVYSSEFGPTVKEQGGQFYGTSGSVPVRPGPGGLNTWAFTVDTTSFSPGEYLVIVSGVEVSLSRSTSFDLVPAVPTSLPTTLPPTFASPVTTPPTSPSPVTTPPTSPPVPTTASVPGFDAGITLTGIGALSLILIRRKR